MVTTQSQNQDHSDCHRPPKMMVSAFVTLAENAAPVEVRRGMAVFTGNGVKAGKVAAIAIDKSNQAATHIVLCCPGQPPEYRLAPVSLIERVDQAGILLRISSHDVASLAKR